MDSQDCVETNEDTFQRITCEFKNRCDLLFLLLRTLLNIKCYGKQFVIVKNIKNI